MKKNELENAISSLKIIKEISNKLDFNNSTAINQQYIKILPILEKELDKMEKNTIDINCPKLILIKFQDIGVGETIADTINNKLAELSNNDFKIIDFNLYNNTVSADDDIIAYIKYTN